MIVYKGTCINKRGCPLYKNAKHQKGKIGMNEIRSQSQNFKTSPIITLCFGRAFYIN